MFNIEIVSQEPSNFNVYENIEVNFPKSIELNPKLLREINKVYERTLNNQAKFILGCFHLNIFDSLESIVANTCETDDFILDLSEFIADYFDKMEYDLQVNSLKEFHEFMHILKLSSIIINDAVEENDMELIFEAFYQIQSRFKKEFLINEEFLIHYIHNFGCNGEEPVNTRHFSTTLNSIEVDYDKL